MAYSQMWFGTEQYSQFIDAPVRGADVSSRGWDAGGGLLNGGAYQRNSWGSHKEYIFEWRESSTLDKSQLMKNYRDGIYGRGLLYFIDPATYDKNILPARWAAPQMAVGDEGAPLVYGVYPEEVVTSGFPTNEIPAQSAYYNLASIASGYRGADDTLFVPVPTGMTLYLGAMYQSTGSGGVYASPVTGGVTGTAVALTPVGNVDTVILPDTFSGIDGVRLWVGKGSAGASSVTGAALIARLYRSDRTPPASFTQGPWVGGMGHSGCRFVGVPTLTRNTGIRGGTAGYAATFVEVGDWL